MPTVLAGNVKNRYKNQAQLFLTCLLAPFLAGQLRLRLLVGCVGSVGLMVGLTIGGAVSMTSEAAIGLSGQKLL